MTGQDHRPGGGVPGRIGEEVEGEPLRVDRPRGERQPELQERVEETPLRRFELTPAGEVLGLRQIRHHPVVPAGAAELRVVLGRDQPVAGIVPRIGAEANEAGGLRAGAPDAVGSFERGHRERVREIAEPPPAAFAEPVLEIERLPAGLTFEEFHRRSGRIACAAGRPMWAHPHRMARVDAPHGSITRQAAPFASSCLRGEGSAFGRPTGAKRGRGGDAG